MLSHELRNPLAPIRNSLFILDRAPPGGDQARRAQAIIDRQVGHLAHLVDDLLDVTRVARNKIRLQCEPLDLTDLVRRTVDDHRSLFEKGEIHIETALPADAAQSLREALDLCGPQVQVTNNGPAGLSRARAFCPEVVLCDIGLPGMDGYEVARAFRADGALKDVFLVALSGYALPEDQQRAAEAGFDQHVAKPPRLDKLEELLSSLRERSSSAQ